MKWKLPVLAGAVIIAAAVVVASATQVSLLARPASINAADLPTIIVDAGHGGIDGGAVGAKRESIFLSPSSWSRC